MKTLDKLRRLRMGRAASLVWKSSRGLTITSAVLTIIQGLLPLLPLYLMKLLIDRLEEAVNTGDSSAFGYLALLVAAMGGVMLVSAAVKAVAGVVETAQSRVVTDYMQDKLHKKSISVDLAYYEDSRYYDSLHRAQREAPFRPTSIVKGLIDTAQNAVSLLAMTGLLISFHWLVAVILVVASIPGLLVKLKFSRISWKWQRRRTETERRAWYKHWLLTSAGHAKELRLFGLGEHFRNMYRKLRKTLREEMLNIARRRALADLGTQVMATVLVYGSLAFIVHRTLAGAVTIGGMVMYFRAFQKGLGYLKGLLGSIAGLYEGNLFLSNLFEFLDLEPAITSPDKPRKFPDEIEEGIRFHNVSFSYPSGRGNVLKGVSLNIGKGETLALVGENGCGKTTLVKLLCRLYDPDEGTVSVDGIPLTDFDLRELRANVSVIFQDYARYHLTAMENIAMGDINRKCSEEDVQTAAEVAGVHDLISSLPEGYRSVLGKWFQEGSELSIGEWQKIALARAFFRDAGIVILDEPTSALDARAERELFRRFQELSRGRTSIVISHRFSTVRTADRIAVMKEGRIMEVGSHQELMTRRGIYSDMYSLQACAFKD
ncbi:MAG: ATP-binding cassette domain-containing protein [Candidatus Aegiribacteria sp.]|nr:ATP-binding cassette domain-containing protein [Candidatus Aegiribacteria sp.]MBD3294541.1 ATP-binding cassette domain-containing protein [Candidatus Fermentibacteria bacterium]